MPVTDTTRRLPPDTITQDIQALNGLKAIKGYQTIRPETSLDSLQLAYQAMLLQQQLLTERQASYKATADAAKQAEWAFHNAVLAMKEAVRGQYGSDSNEVQAVGFKKKSNRKRPVKTKASGMAAIV
jgi:hypothetical protein